MKVGKNLPGATRADAPCHERKERHKACHGTCLKFAEFKAYVELVQENRKMYVAMDQWERRAKRRRK